MKAIFRVDVLVVKAYGRHTKYDVIDEVMQPIIIPNILEVTGHIEECVVVSKESIIKFNLSSPRMIDGLSRIYKVLVEYNTRGSISLFFRTREDADQFKEDIIDAIDDYLGSK